MADQYEEAGNRGHSYIWEQRWEEAVEAFQLALQGRPNEPDLYDGLATAQKELGRFADALNNYQEAARLSNGDVIYLEQLGEMQQKQGLFEKVAAFDNHTPLHPHNYQIYLKCHLHSIE